MEQIFKRKALTSIFKGDKVLHTVEFDTGKILSVR